MPIFGIKLFANPPAPPPPEPTPEQVLRATHSDLQRQKETLMLEERRQNACIKQERKMAEQAAARGDKTECRRHNRTVQFLLHAQQRCSRDLDHITLRELQAPGLESRMISFRAMRQQDEAMRRVLKSMDSQSIQSAVDEHQDLQNKLDLVNEKMEQAFVEPLGMIEEEACREADAMTARDMQAFQSDLDNMSNLATLPPLSASDRMPVPPTRI